MNLQSLQHDVIKLTHISFLMRVDHPAEALKKRVSHEEGTRGECEQ